MIHGPDHVAVAVADAAAAIRFFGLLGFRMQHEAKIDGGVPAAYMGMPDMKARHLTLVLEGAEPHFEIQLLEFDPTPGDDPGELPTNRRRRGYNHLAFRVDDIAAVTAHLVANGVQMLSERWTTSAGAFGSSKAPKASPWSWCSGWRSADLGGALGRTRTCAHGSGGRCSIR